MTKTEAIEPSVFEAQWDKPTRVQVELTQLLASGRSRTELPASLVDDFYDHVFEVWTCVTASAEDNVLMALFSLTIDRGNRDCLINPNELWPAMRNALSAGLLKIIDEETQIGCPQTIHLIALEGMIEKGMIVRSFVRSNWICSINFLWNPGFELIPLYKSRSTQTPLASLENQQLQGGRYA